MNTDNECIEDCNTADPHAEIKHGKFLYCHPKVQIETVS